MVLDCAAICRGRSPNGILYRGQDIIAGLIRMLLLFQKERIVVSADTGNFHAVQDVLEQQEDTEILAMVMRRPSRVIK